jgi:signal transduction histidine kinase
MLARADAGQRRIAETDLSLDEVVGDAARAVRSLADGRGVRVVVEPGPELPCRGDAELLSRMFVNLLDNAIKYTPSGGEVRVHAEARGSDLVVTVTDTGVGIPEEARAHVFERFYRVERARATAAEGSGAGLGLSIARWIAGAHGGTLELVASSEHGTTFEVRLPRSRKKDNGEAHRPPPLPPSRRSAK